MGVTLSGVADIREVDAGLPDSEISKRVEVCHAPVGGNAHTNTEISGNRD